MKVYIFILLLLVALYWLAFWIQKKDSPHAQFFYEIIKPILTTVLLALLALIFKKPLYFHFLRPELSILTANQECKMTNEFNYVWRCGIPLANPFDSPINGRKYKVRSKGEKHNFVKCSADGTTEGVISTEKGEDSCKYRISITPNGEETLVLEISAEKNEPKFEFEEISL